jgi:hypothetical protein
MVRHRKPFRRTGLTCAAALVFVAVSADPTVRVTGAQVQPSSPPTADIANLKRRRRRG